MINVAHNAKYGIIRLFIFFFQNKFHGTSLNRNPEITKKTGTLNEYIKSFNPLGEK